MKVFLMGCAVCLFLGASALFAGSCDSLTGQAYLDCMKQQQSGRGPF